MNVHIIRLFIIRVLKIDKDSKLVKGGTPSGRITITQVCKPHTQAITTIAVDNEGSTLATGVSSVLLLYIITNLLFYIVR